MGVDSITELIQGIPVDGPEVSDVAAYVVLLVGVQQEISGEPQQVEAASGNTEDLRMCGGVVQHTNTPQEEILNVISTKITETQKGYGNNVVVTAVKAVPLLTPSSNVHL